MCRDTKKQSGKKVKIHLYCGDCRWSEISITDCLPLSCLTLLAVLSTDTVSCSYAEVFCTPDVCKKWLIETQKWFLRSVLCGGDIKSL